MRSGRIIVVYKKSTLALYEDLDAVKELPKKNAALYRELKKADQDHYRSVELLMKKLEGFHEEIVVHRRGEDRMPKINDNDIVLAIGGDGTFIYVSHYVKHAVMIGVNSAPNHSVGHYCAFNLFDKSFNMPAIIEAVRSQKIRPTDIYRLRVWKNGEELKMRVINDALFTDVNPAITSRYEININKNSRRQKSSGLWIATAMGSSAAFRSAGGKPFKQFSPEKKRQFGVAIRELYGEGGKKNEIMMIDETQKFEVVSSMIDGILFLDGGQKKVRVDIGDKIGFDFHERALPVVMHKDLRSF